MKILMTALYFPCVNEKYDIITDKLYGSKYCGGAESFIFSFAKHLSDRGIEVELFTFNPACKGVTINFENIRIHYFGKIFKIPFLNKKYIPLSTEFYKSLNDSDLIHCQGSFYHPLTDLVCILKLFHKKPIIVTHHATQGRITIIHRLRDRLGIRFLKFADKIIIPSKNSRYLYSKYLDKLEEIPLGIITSTFKPLENKNDLRKSRNLPTDVPIILFAGYLVHYKGVYKLIEAFEIVKREISDALLIISGDGPVKDNLKSIVKKKDLAKSVVFLGRTLHSRICELYNLSDLLVLLSIKDEKYLPEGECFPISILEAMSCSLPVVVTNVGGPKCIVEPEFGLRVDPLDVQGIAEAAISILSDKNLRYKMGKEARKKAVEKYDIERVVDRYIDLYKFESKKETG